MVEVGWRKFNTWSGCKIDGTEPYVLLEAEKIEHVKRALWLTVQVESGGLFGAINSYDGAGMSAGLEHKIAIYPKIMKQGSLWGLLNEMRLYSPCSDLLTLYDSFRREAKWFVTSDGTVRDCHKGTLISAQTIRSVLTPPNGKVLQSGQSWIVAKEWATLFHNLFSNKQTHKVQINSAIRSLVESNKKIETEAYLFSVGTAHPSLLEVGKNFNLSNDLAWCVYHSFSVNAPSEARRQLEHVRTANKDEFAKMLIRNIGTSKYGFWHFSTDAKSRYNRTRKFAMRSGLWSMDLFVGQKAIMPEKF